MGPIGYASTYDETDGLVSGQATLVRLVRGPAVRISVAAWISDDNVPVQEFTAQLFSGVCETAMYNSWWVLLPSLPATVVASLETWFDASSTASGPSTSAQSQRLSTSSPPSPLQPAPQQQQAPGCGWGRHSGSVSAGRKAGRWGAHKHRAHHRGHPRPLLLHRCLRRGAGRD